MCCSCPLFLSLSGFSEASSLKSFLCKACSQNVIKIPKICTIRLRCHKRKWSCWFSKMASWYTIRTQKSYNVHVLKTCLHCSIHFYQSCTFHRIYMYMYYMILVLMEFPYKCCIVKSGSWIAIPINRLFKKNRNLRLLQWKRVNIKLASYFLLPTSIYKTVKSILKSSTSTIQ